jgi:23S rRNA pseudouridine1911/1915/1917 synthase
MRTQRPHNDGLISIERNILSRQQQSQKRYQKKYLEIDEGLFGQRIDKALASQLDNYSRSTIQSWIKQDLVLVDDEVVKAKDKIVGGESVEISIPDEEGGDWQAEEMEIDVIFEDEYLAVINKPAGLVVHPGAGNLNGTLLNGILSLWPDNRSLPRAGIVHRLDKDTSGLMMIAKSEVARLGLTEQLADHSLYRSYHALVIGNVISGGSVDEPIARDKHNRLKMAVNSFGKEAVSHYRVEERFTNHTLLTVELETGRTHQIRVHMSFLGYPLLGDPQYGRRLAIPKGASENLELALRGFKRQALHAKEISFVHPVSGDQCRFECPYPEDFKQLVSACREDA